MTPLEIERSRAIADDLEEVATVASPHDPGGVELLLDPSGFPAAAAHLRALFEAGIPLTAFAVDDVRAEYDRVRERSVAFSMEPTPSGPTRPPVTRACKCGCQFARSPWV